MKAVDVFRAACPDGFLRDIAGGLASVYALVDDHVRSILRYNEEISNTMPWVRRGLVEQMLRDVAAGYPSQITVKMERGGLWFRAELSMGRVTLTQYAAFDPELSLRPAIYRTELAKKNRQMSLFPDFQEIDIPEDSDLYAVLLHGRRPDTFGRVGSAVIKFPMPNVSEGFFDEEIDLFEEYPEAFANLDTPHEVIEDTAIPELHDSEQTGTE